MLKHLATALLMGGSLAVPAAANPTADRPAASQAVAPSLFDSLVPRGASLDLRERQDAASSSKAAGAVLRAQTVEIGMVGLSMRILENGKYLLTLDRATVMPRIPSAPRMSVTGLAMVFDRPLPDGDLMCSWLDAVSTVALDAMQIDRTGGEGDWISAMGRDLEWRSAGQGGCSIGGRLSAQELTARQPDQRIHTISGIEVTAWLPGSPDASAVLAGPARLEVNAEEIEISRAGEVPTFGASGAHMSLDAQMGTLAAPAALLRAANPFRYVWPGAALAMQGYNASLAADVDLHVSADAIRIYSAGVMPSHLIRNFGRAGLSTITGRLSADLALRQGLGRLRQSIELTGVGTQKLMVEFEASPYQVEKVELAAKSVDLGLHAVPDIVILRAGVELQDDGFSAAMREVTGMPLTSNITSESILQLLAPTSSEGTILKVTRALREFAREVVSGKMVQVDVVPRERTSILQMLSQLLADPLQLPVYMSSNERES